MRTAVLVVGTVLLLGSSMHALATGPTPTPAPRAFPMAGGCSASPCEGNCLLCAPCTPGTPCPEIACVLGQCQMVSDTCACVPGIPVPPPTAAECDQSCEPGTSCGQFSCGLETVQGVCESTSSGCVCVPPPCVFLTPTPTPTSPTPPQPCSAAACEGPCTLPIPCPLGVGCPMQLGQCESSASGECECVPVVPTPFATPTPQCNAVPCGGDCTISFPCTNGPPCPEVPVRLGHCESTSTSTCECVPIGPTPLPTPTPQCASASCGGSCTISFPPIPCPRPGVCNGPVLLGQCEVTGSGDCKCVPVSPTPTATPTPQCTGDTCGGPCVITFPCPAGLACPDLAQLGQCQSSATGACECMPVGSTPLPTPTPECSGETCEGPCVVSFPPFPCPAGEICNGPNIPVELGQCELNSSGVCECVPETPPPSPTPLATPTPQCDGVACGGQCVISPPCASRGCEVPDLLGTCEMVSGSCTCVPETTQAIGSEPVHRSPHHRRYLHPRIPDQTRH
jgi:hypothetical protein